MPYSMPFSEQKHKWFTVVLFIILPFYVLFKLIRGELPSLDKVKPE